MNEQEIFQAALERTGQDRVDFLAEVCCDDSDLRARIQKLLQLNDQSADFFNKPAGEILTGDASTSLELNEQEIGPYKIREKIGEGGMGVVYVAEQTEPVQRRVAIKIIKPGMDTKEVIARFEAERQALAFMEHPNIARVLDAGATESGRSYFVMELVRGIPITEYCDQVKATPQERLELFQTVCDAVQHAHQKGIIHRDIKPSNVLVTQVSAKPVVKVIDFGLAKATSGQKLTDKTVYTGFMKLMGTPVYMSPEQAGLSGLDVDTRSDVYSLGVLLYELLTGTTPLNKTEIQKHAYDELCRKIREIEAPKPSARISTLKYAERSTIAQQRQVEPGKLRQMLDGDLDVVVLKALEKDRDRRYATPQDLSTDIDRFLGDKPVKAVPPSPLYIARKYIRRHKAAMLTAAFILISLLLATAFSTWQAIRATRYGKESNAAKRQAVAAKNAAEDAERNVNQIADERRRLLYLANMQLADQLYRSADGDLRSIEALLTAWVPTDDVHDLRDFCWRYQWTRLHRNASITVSGTSAVAISPMGNLITADNSGVYEWDDSGSSSVPLWRGDASNAAFSSDGRWSAITVGETTKLVKLGSGSVDVLEIPYQLNAFTAGSKFFYAWKVGDTKFRTWSLSAGIPSDASVVDVDVALPPASNQMSLADDGISFLLRRHPRFSHVSVFAADSDPVPLSLGEPVFSSSWSPNRRIIASGLKTGLVDIRLRSDLASKWRIGTSGKGIHAILFTPDGTTMATGASDGTIDLWDISAPQDSGPSAEPPSRAKPATSTRTNRAPRLIRSIKAHLKSVQSLAFSADGSELASIDSSGTSKLWKLAADEGRFDVGSMAEDLVSGTTGLVLEKADVGLRVIRIIPEFHEPLCGEIEVGDRLIGIAEAENGVVSDVSDMELYAAWSLLSGPTDSEVTVSCLATEGTHKEAVLRRRRLGVRSLRLAFTPDSEQLAIASEGAGVTTLSLSTGKTRRYRTWIGSSVAFSPAGLLAVDNASEVLLWDLESERLHRRLDASVKGTLHSSMGFTGTLAFSPNGKYLAIGTGDWLHGSAKRSDLKVWRTSDFEEIGSPLFENDRVVSAVAFTQDSSQLVAGDHAGRVRIWDTSNWQLRRTINVGTSVVSLSLSRDSILATAGESRIVLFDFETGKQLRVLTGVDPQCVDFSPDGRTLVSGNTNHSVVLWDVATGMQLLRLHGHGDEVRGVAFSPDGNTLASSGKDGTLRVWKAAPLHEIASYPPTLESMLRLGELRNEQARFAEAEAILRKLLQLQQQTLPGASPEVLRTRAALQAALQGQRDLAASGQPPPENGEP